MNKFEWAYIITVILSVIAFYVALTFASLNFTRTAVAITAIDLIILLPMTIAFKCVHKGDGL